MSLEIEVDAFLADYAKTENGKIDTLGAGWNVLWTNSFPKVHSMFICTLIHIPYTALGEEHKIRLELIDQDGRKIVLYRVQTPGGIHSADSVEVKIPPSSKENYKIEDEFNVPIIIPITNVQFDAPGRYTFVIYVNSEAVKRVPITVSPVPQTQ